MLNMALNSANSEVIKRKMLNSIRYADDTNMFTDSPVGTSTWGRIRDFDGSVHETAQKSF